MIDLTPKSSAYCGAFYFIPIKKVITATLFFQLKNQSLPEFVPQM